jgi:hypothetical protein
MKQVIAFIATIVIAASSFATSAPYTPKFKLKNNTVTIAKKSALSVSLISNGKVNLSWDAVEETTSTVYRIERSTDGVNYATKAYLMGESIKSYSFVDKIKKHTGKITYRVVVIDNDKVISTYSQTFIVL